VHTSEEGEVNWPEDLYKAPVYVVTHEKREPCVQKGSTTFYFVNDGIERGLSLAKANAKGQDIRIQGGANIIQHYLNAGLVDEFTIHNDRRRTESTGCKVRSEKSIIFVKLRSQHHGKTQTQNHAAFVVR
jgi:dihydrofolate reductase